MPNFFLTPRDNLQVRAFISVWACHPELPATERFSGAIVATSDDVFARAKPELIEQWFKEFSTKARRKDTRREESLTPCKAL